MALAAYLAELQTETSCPVCLAPLRDPVILECGHNCCGPCLHQCWEGLLEVLPCPVCQHNCPSRDVRRNPMLGSLADLLRQMPTTSGQRKRRDNEEDALCAQHQQALDLFCEEDLELLCVQCGPSSPYRGHSLVPAEQAAAHHRRKLKSCLVPIRRQLEEAERGLALQVSRSRELREKTDAGRSALRSGFAHFKRFLGLDHLSLDSQVLREMTGIYQKVRESRNQMSKFRCSLRNLLCDITSLCVQTDLDLLRDVGSIHHQWSRCVCLEAPEAYSYELEEVVCSLPLHYLSLQNVISRFQADLTLDPETAHHSLVSPDGKTAIFSGEMAGPNSVLRPQVFTFSQAVLGAAGFQAGRHFWQVDIRGSGVWSLGVSKKSFPRNGLMPPSPCNGCWQFLQTTGIHLDSHTAQTRVGVFLDHELGELSFYNMQTRTHLHTLIDTFTDKLFLYFSAGPSSLLFSMTLITDEPLYTWLYHVPLLP